ncbi:MAG: hypothetical protein ACXWQO_13940, partial [Bdellovibrionota bacterium]
PAQFDSLEQKPKTKKRLHPMGEVAFCMVAPPRIEATTVTAPAVPCVASPPSLRKASRFSSPR